jgi:lysophospholipase L1-like esterase
MLRHSFAAEGAYDVTLTVRDPDREVKFTRTVVVQDWLVASIGDSVGSGEGNPDVPATFGRARWQSAQCHRSSHAASARAALALENADPHTSVTFLHVACSGAEVDPGLLTGYKGIDPGPLLPPQLAELSQVAAAGREIDAVIVNVGANDVLFGPVASFCLRKGACVDRRFRGDATTREAVRERLAELPGRYDRLAETLDDIVAPSRVFLVDYFDPTRDEDGITCKHIRFATLDIDEREATWAQEEVLAPLNEEVEQAAARHGWNLVDGVADAFTSHGYCSTDRWVRTLEQSLDLVGATMSPEARVAGTLHPNIEGHRRIGLLLNRAFERVLYPNGEARLPDEADEPPSEPDRTTPWLYVAIGLGVAALLGGIVLLIILRRRRAA